MASLNMVLTQMVHKATKSSGIPQRTKLRSGLAVDVLVFNGKTKLQLSRDGIEPSHNEYKTILKYWPYPLEELPPTHCFKHQSRCYLQAEWPTPQLLSLEAGTPAESRLPEQEGIQP